MSVGFWVKAKGVEIYGVESSGALGAGIAMVTVTAGAQTTVTFTDVRTGITTPAGAFQVRYAAHLGVGDSVIDISNRYRKVSVIACCSCLVTPNGLASLSSNNDLISNT